MWQDLSCLRASHPVTLRRRSDLHQALSGLRHSLLLRPYAVAQREIDPDATFFIQHFFCMIERSFCALDAQPGPGQFQVQYVHCIRIPDCGPFNRETAARKLLFRLPETQTTCPASIARIWKLGRLALASIWCGKFGERDGIRTHDLLIKSQLLYRLSYALPWARNAALEIARNIGRVPRPVNRKKTGFQGGFLERIRRGAEDERLSMPAPTARLGAASESPTITMG